MHLLANSQFCMISCISAVRISSMCVMMQAGAVVGEASDDGKMP